MGGAPEKEYFIFKSPMPAKGREENLLGVAFEDPRIGTLGSFTPQGPQETQAAGEDQPSNNNSTSRDNLAPTQLLPPPQASLETPTKLEVINYRTACRWPKFLADKVYPNKATEAIGVEQILKNVTGGNVAATILETIAITLKLKRDDLDKSVIPILRRWSMEDPKGKINDLLHNDDYRSRVIDLFEQQTNPTKPKILYVATGLIACGGLSLVHVKGLDSEFKIKGGDPTDTIDLKLEARAYKIKKSTLKGTYKSDVVMCMSYRRVRYERVGTDPPGIWQSIFAKKQQPHDKLAIKFARDDGAKDVFWIDKYDAEGQIAAWMSLARRKTENFLGTLNPLGNVVNNSEQGSRQAWGSIEDAKDAGILEEATFYKGEPDDGFDQDDFPPGFFGEDFDFREEWDNFKNNKCN